MIATSIEQSLHLLKLGLDPSTADMMWDDWSLIDEGWKISVGYYPEIEKDYGRKCYPAWSLVALLEVIPMVNERWPVCCKIYGSEKWHVLYHSTAVTPKIDSGEYDTPIEAAYELVCCLLEQGLIKKGDNDVQ